MKKNNNGAHATLDQNTYTIVITDQPGGLVTEPSSVAVKAGDTVVWSYDGPNKFQVSFGPFTTYESEDDNGQQSLRLPVVTEFSSPASYEIGQAGQSDSSSFGGVITCSTCPQGD